MEVELKNCVVDFRGEKLTVWFSRYMNPKNIVILFKDEMEQLYGKATTNLHDVQLPDSEVLIKTWSENEGVEKVLQEAGIIGKKLREIPSGYVRVGVYELLRKPEEKF